MSDRRRQAGFTLLELVVGIALLAMIAALLVNVLGTGIAATKQVDQRTERIERVYHVHALLRRRLQSVRPLEWEFEGRGQPIFVGEGAAIRFVATAPPWPGLGGLVLDRLYLDGGRLMLAEQPFAGDFNAANAHSTDRSKALAEGLGTLRIDYFGSADRQGPDWHGKWSQPRLPELVRIRISWRDGSSWPDLVVRPRLAPQPR